MKGLVEPSLPGSANARALVAGNADGPEINPEGRRPSSSKAHALPERRVATVAER